MLRRLLPIRRIRPHHRPLDKRAGFLLATVLGVVDPNCTLNQICPHVDEHHGPRQRPNDAQMKALKERQIKSLGLDPSKVYEEDHIVPICLCGATHDPNNLTPEPWPQAGIKDRFEASFHKAVCAGTMKLEDAQHKIVSYE